VFAAAAVGTGSYEDINRAFRRQPESTTEILEPDRYFAKWRAPRLRLPPLAVLGRNGYRRSYEDTLGRIELTAFLRQGGIAGDAIARAWEGDRIRIYRRGDTPAAVWIVGFDQPDDAAKAAEQATVGFARLAEGAGGSFLAYHYIHYAILVRNIEQRLHSALRREIEQWINSDRIRVRGR
jgi:hypothetical protein